MLDKKSFYLAYLMLSELSAIADMLTLASVGVMLTQ